MVWLLRGAAAGCLTNLLLVAGSPSDAAVLGWGAATVASAILALGVR